MWLSRLVFRAGNGFRLYQFLIIVFVTTFTIEGLISIGIYNTISYSPSLTDIFKDDCLQRFSVDFISTYFLFQ